MMHRQAAAAISVLGAVAAMLPWFLVVEPWDLGQMPLFLAMLPLILWGSGITSLKPWAVQIFVPVLVAFAAFGVLGAGLAISRDGASLLPVASVVVALAAPVAAWVLWRRGPAV